MRMGGRQAKHLAFYFDGISETFSCAFGSNKQQFGIKTGSALMTQRKQIPFV